MKLYSSSVTGSKGEKFFRCSGQDVGCNGFRWLREAIVIEGGKKVGGKLKLEINGPVSMSVEGDVNDITQLVRNLSVSKS